MKGYNYSIVQVPKEWCSTQGNNTTVLICDTGCETNHSMINGFVKECISFVPSKFTRASIHGTHVTGIIRSLACESTAIAAQVISGDKGEYRWLKKALLWALEREIDVVNLSLSYHHDSEDIRKCIEELDKRGTIVSASYSPAPNPYPAIYENVVSVSSYKTMSADSDIFGPHEFRSAVPHNNMSIIKGHSMSAAFFSGIALLAKSYDRSIERKGLLESLRSQKPFPEENNIDMSSNRGCQHYSISVSTDVSSH